MVNDGRLANVRDADDDDGFVGCVGSVVPVTLIDQPTHLMDV